MRVSIITLGALALAAAAPAAAQEAPSAVGEDAAAPPTTVSDPSSATIADPAGYAPAIRITGGATLISDYRFRGLSQTDRDPAVQGTINVTSPIGYYAGAWASTIDGDRKPGRARSAGSDITTGSAAVRRGYGDAEVDLYAGYTSTLRNGVGVDAGLLYYFYPGNTGGVATDFFEPYASLAYTLGPVAAKAGASYAWGGQQGLDVIGGRDDSLYLFGEGSIGIPTTPVTLKGHVGRTRGALGLVNLNPDNHGYWDWSATAEAVGGPLKVGVSYVDTTITSRYVPGFRGRFDQHLGRGWTMLGYVGVTF